MVSGLKVFAVTISFIIMHTLKNGHGVVQRDALAYNIFPAVLTVLNLKNICRAMLKADMYVTKVKCSVIGVPLPE